MGKTVQFTEDQIKDIYDLYYNQHQSFKALGEKYHHTQRVFTRVFKEQGWKPKSQTCKYSKYTLDEHYFDEIDTPDKAYILGIFYADGCNRPSEKKLTMELQIDDYDVLYQINQQFKNTRPIQIYDASLGTNRTKNTCRIVLFSEHLSLRANEINLVPHKSLTLDFPYWMNKELIPYMLRGYIDGDGWVQQYRIGFMSTDKFCYGVQQYLNSIGLECHVRDMKRHYNEHTKTCDISNRKNIIPLTEKMFSDGTIFMKRKVEKYIEYGFLKQNNSLID